jgi:halimadienyl-diphosphate synthase
MTQPRIAREELAEEARRLLASLDEGEMAATAYDTAWVARVPDPILADRPLYLAAYDWVLRNQHSDGSWGSDLPFAHDRVISTLAALITLVSSSYRRPESELAARRAVVYLNVQRLDLRNDPAETVGFELLLPEMVREAQALRLSLPYDDWRFIDTIKEDKLRRIPPIAVYGGPTPLTHSFEYLGDRLLPSIASRCRFDDGSYGISPSSTAYVHLQAPEPETARYLDRVASVLTDGGVPYVHPFDIFETAWVLYLLGPLVEGTPEERALTERLWQDWTPLGVSWTRESSVTDVDDTAVLLLLFTRARKQIDTDIFQLFETADYFQTYIFERNPSVTSNAHVLSVLRAYPSTPERRRMIVKIVHYLTQSVTDGGYWDDKWHASPYYATNEVIAALAGLNDNLVRRAIEWVQATQHENGAWGQGEGTAEETAWALLSLASASETDAVLRAVTATSVERGAAYLREHLDDGPPPALWIGKSLYTPPNIVKAIFLRTLYESQPA